MNDTHYNLKFCQSNFDPQTCENDKFTFTRLRVDF
jgi:hypothetical protein